MKFKIHARVRKTAYSATPTKAEHPLPSLPRRVVNFGKAAAAEVAHKILRRPARTEAEKALFLATCRNCPGRFYDEATDTCHHPKCGCPMGRKSRWNSTYCPAGYVKFEEATPAG